MNSKVLFAVLICLGIALFAATAYLYWARDTEPGFAIDDPEREFDALATSTIVPVVFVLRNASSKDVRIVGLTEC